MATSYDPTLWLSRRIDFQPAYSFSTLGSSASAGDIAAWRHNLRRQVQNRLGVFSLDPKPTRVEVLETHETPAYTRQSVSFETMPGLQMFAHVLTPAAEAPASGERAALLCLAGHGVGVDPLVGLDPSGHPLSAPDYHNRFAIDAVERGYVVIAPEILGYGRRRQGAHAADSGESSCQTLSGAALMLGETLAGWRITEALRCLDYLQERPDVDRARLAVMGISGGGLIALFTAALDTRVEAAVISGYFNTFTGSVMSLWHCIDNFIPGLRRDAEMSDIAGLVAPRALWCENGDADPIFPAASFVQAAKETSKIYAAAGAGDKFQSRIFAGEHRFDGTGCWEFLGEALGADRHFSRIEGVGAWNPKPAFPQAGPFLPIREEEKPT